MQVVTQALTRRLEAAETACWWAAFSALGRWPGNPYGFELRAFGNARALLCRALPQSGSFNKVLCAGAADMAALDEALAYAAEAGVRAMVEVNPGDQDEALLEHLRLKGYAARVFCSVLYGMPVPPAAPPAAGVPVRRAQSEADVETAVRIHREGMGIGPKGQPLFRDLALAVSRHPEWRIYLAEVDGEPAAQAWMHVANGTGTMVAGATLPVFRGRGAQSALIGARLADAAAAGCDLVCSQTDPVTVSQHNMERAGLRMAYTKVEFHPIA